LLRQNGVTGARINYDCSSLVVEFDPSLESLFRLLLGRLRLMTVDELAAMLNKGASSQVTRYEASTFLPRNKLSVSKHPLTLPTLSIVMAFVANPWVI